MEEFYEDPALLQAFLVESQELLQGMDQDLVELEKAPDSEELLNRIFRALHTVKGTAGFLGFHPIVQLGHRAEDVLNALRRREIHVSPRVMTALLGARDRLGEMLTDLGAGGLKPQYDTARLVAGLEQVQKTGGSSSTMSLPTPWTARISHPVLAAMILAHRQKKMTSSAIPCGLTFASWMT